MIDIVLVAAIWLGGMMYLLAFIRTGRCATNKKTITAVGLFGVLIGLGAGLGMLGVILKLPHLIVAGVIFGTLDMGIIRGYWGRPR